MSGPVGLLLCLSLVRPLGPANLIISAECFRNTSPSATVVQNRTREPLEGPPRLPLSSHKGQSGWWASVRHTQSRGRNLQVTPSSITFDLVDLYVVPEVLIRDSYRPFSTSFYPIRWGILTVVTVPFGSSVSLDVFTGGSV